MVAVPPGWLVGVTLLAVGIFAAFYGTAIFEDGFPTSFSGFVLFLPALAQLLTFDVFGGQSGLPFLVKLGLLLGITVPWLGVIL